MYSIKPVSNPLSSFKGESLDSTSIQSLLTLLGWKDMQPPLELAENQDRVLAQSLQHAYEAYHTAPNPVSKLYLNVTINSVIEKLDADAEKAAQLAQAATLRLKQRETNRESIGYISGWMGSIKEGLQSLFGSDDTALVKRYTALAESYQSKRAALEAYCDLLADTGEIGLQPSQITDEEQKVEKKPQRRLLSETTVPNTIPDQVAYVGEMYEFTIDVTEVFGAEMQTLAITGNFPDWIQPDYYPLIANCPLLSTANAVTVVGTKAYVAAGVAGLYILDVANPSTPVILGNYDTPGVANKVAVSSNTAYVADRGSLQILNVSNPGKPTYLSSYSKLGAVLDVVLDGNLAYVIDDSLLQLLSISNVRAPSIMGNGFIVGVPNHLTIHNGVVYISTSMGVYTYGYVAPALLAPTTLGQYVMPGQPASVNVVGTIAYVTEYATWKGLQIINVTNPAVPTLLGQYATATWAFSVTVVGTTAYVGEDAYNPGIWFQIINVANPSAPTLLGQLSGASTAYGVTVVGTRAYVTATGPSSGRLHIIRMGNLRNLGSYPTANPVLGINIFNNTATVALGNAEIQALSWLNATNPTKIGTASTSGAAQSITQVGGAAYVSEGSNGFQIFNMANLSKPILIGAYDTPGSTTSITIVNNTAYVADGAAGVQILNLTKIRLRGTPSSFNMWERYSFTVTATDAFGNWAARSFQITVKPLPTIVHNQLSLQNGGTVS